MQGGKKQVNNQSDWISFKPFTVRNRYCPLSVEQGSYCWEGLCVVAGGQQTNMESWVLVSVYCLMVTTTTYPLKHVYISRSRDGKMGKQWGLGRVNALSGWRMKSNPGRVPVPSTWVLVGWLSIFLSIINPTQKAIGIVINVITSSNHQFAIVLAQQQTEQYPLWQCRKAETCRHLPTFPKQEHTWKTERNLRENILQNKIWQFNCHCFCLLLSVQFSSMTTDWTGQFVLGTNLTFFFTACSGGRWPQRSCGCPCWDGAMIMHMLMVFSKLV